VSLTRLASVAQGLGRVAQGLRRVAQGLPRMVFQGELSKCSKDGQVSCEASAFIGESSFLGIWCDNCLLRAA